MPRRPPAYVKVKAAQATKPTRTAKPTKKPRGRPAAHVKVNKAAQAHMKPTRTAKPTKKSTGSTLNHPLDVTPDAFCQDSDTATAIIQRLENKVLQTKPKFLLPKPKAQPTNKPAKTLHIPPNRSGYGRMRDAEAARAGPLHLTPPMPMPKPDSEWKEVDIVIEDKGSDFAHACTVESNAAIQQQHVVETTLVWPNAGSAREPLGQYPFYVVQFTEEKKARVVTPLYIGQRVDGSLGGS